LWARRSGAREGRARRWPNSGRRRRRYPFKGGGAVEGGVAGSRATRGGGTGKREEPERGEKHGRVRLIGGIGDRKARWAVMGCGASTTARHGADTWPGSRVRAV
jgi:hypothetical protein